MKRLHVHVAVTDLAENIRFYSALFGVEPTVTKPDYAKWMLDDPRVNFAVSSRRQSSGLDHLGIQVESDEELNTVHSRLDEAAIPGEEQTGTGCCYARSDKYWTTDPQGIAWESFRTLDSIPTFDGAAGASCCVPANQKG